MVRCIVCGGAVDTGRGLRDCIVRDGPPEELQARHGTLKRRLPTAPGAEPRPLAPSPSCMLLHGSASLSPQVILEEVGRQRLKARHPQADDGDADRRLRHLVGQRKH